MIVGSISENKKQESRVAITPDIVKKYKTLGFEVFLSKNYASHLGISDEEYLTEGANIKSDEEIFLNSNAILQMNILRFINSAEEIGWKEAVRERDEGIFDWTEKRPVP